MRIVHIAIWMPNLEGLKDFYMTYFDARANDKMSIRRKGSHHTA